MPDSVRSDSDVPPSLLSSDLSPLNFGYRQIFGLAVPVLFANIAMPLQGLIDVAIVGHFESTTGLAGMGLAVQLWGLLLVSFNFLQYASSGLAAQALGRGADWADFLAILRPSLGLAILLGGLLWGLHAGLIDLGLGLMAGSVESSAAARLYLQVRFFGVVAELMNFAFLGWLAGQGQSRFLLYQQSFIAVVNVVLTLFFVYGLNLGLVGVALGTALAFWLGVCLAVFLVCRVLDIRVGQFFLGAWQGFAYHDLLRLFYLNKDIFVRTFILTSSFVWITRLSALSGETVLAVNTLLLQVLSLSAFALDGVAVAAETLSGQALGRQDKGVFWQVVKRTGQVMFALAGALVLLWWVGFPHYLHAMTHLQTVLELANDYCYYAILLPLVGAGAYWLDGVFFGLTAGRQIRLAAVTVALVFFPLSWIFVDQWAMTGIWISVWLLLLLRLFCLAWLLWRQILPNFDTILDKSA